MLPLVYLALLYIGLVSSTLFFQRSPKLVMKLSVIKETAFPLLTRSPFPPTASFAKLAIPPIAAGTAPNINPAFCKKYAPVLLTTFHPAFATLSSPDCPCA